MKVTTALLRRKEACGSQVERFRATFGESVEVTLDNLLKAADAGISIGWAGNYLLRGDARSHYLRIISSTDDAAYLKYQRDISSIGHTRAHEVFRSGLQKARAYAFAAALAHTGHEI